MSVNVNQQSDPIKFFIELVGGRWKLLIMRELISGPMRFGELRRSLGNITPKVLTDALRSMEEYGMVIRTVYPEAPLRVEYSLSAAGYELGPIFNSITSCLVDYKLSIKNNVGNDDKEEYYGENEYEIFYKSNLPFNYNDEDYEERLLKAKDLIAQAECLVVGTGSGINYKSDIDHFSKKKAKQLFPRLFNRGLITIDEMINAYSHILPANEVEHWEFWSRFIWELRYERPLSQEHQNLAALVHNKDYFVISTNSDGQLEKAGFSPKRVYLPLGSYSFLQCVFPCEDKVYDTKDYIEQILKHIDNGIGVQQSDIPHCPLCGDYLVPNHYRNKMVSLATSNSMANRNTYMNYLNSITNKNTVLIEIGCGFRMPKLIRSPFEKLIADYKDIHLIRINMKYPELENKELEDKAVLFSENIDAVLHDLLI